MDKKIVTINLDNISALFEESKRLRNVPEEKKAEFDKLFFEAIKLLPHFCFCYKVGFAAPAYFNNYSIFTCWLGNEMYNVYKFCTASSESDFFEKTEKAMNLFDEMIKIAPSSALAFCGYGYTCLILGWLCTTNDYNDFDDIKCFLVGVDYFNKAIELDGLDVIPQYLKAEALMSADWAFIHKDEYQQYEQLEYSEELELSDECSERLHDLREMDMTEYCNAYQLDYADYPNVVNTHEDKKIEEVGAEDEKNEIEVFKKLNKQEMAISVYREIIGISSPYNNEGIFFAHQRLANLTEARFA